MRALWRSLLVVVLAVSSCTKIYNIRDKETSPTAPSTTPAPVVADKIEFRAFGNTGGAPVTIKFTNGVDGLTVQVANSLPYVADISSTEASIFLSLEGTAIVPLLYQPSGILQVQIFTNGRLFREGSAAGFATLTATAFGTWRR